MTQWVEVTQGRYREYIGEALDADVIGEAGVGSDGALGTADEGEFDDGWEEEPIPVRTVGVLGGQPEVVSVARGNLCPVVDMTAAFRGWVAGDHAAAARAEDLAFFVERLDLPYADLAAEWDAYVAHEAGVRARCEARRKDVLEAFDRELAGFAPADLLRAVQRDVARWLPDAVRRAHGGPGDLEPTAEDRLLAAIFGTGEPEPSVWDRARERLYFAERAAAERVYLRWNADTAQAEDHAGLRRAAAERVRRDRPAIEQRCRDVWGVALPESVFRFWEFLLALGPAARTAFDKDLGLYACGIMAVFDDPAWQPADGSDPRMHWRYYWDPPEFVTFLNGPYPGEHYGLWFDDGHTCAGVLGHSPKDNSDFGFPDGGTPLEVIRAQIESFLLDYNEDDCDGDRVPARYRVRLLRETLMRYETGDRPEQGHDYDPRRSRGDDWYRTVDPARVTTLDGAGALVTGATALDRGHQRRGEDRTLTDQIREALAADPAALHRLVTNAKDRCRTGDPAEALALGRDLHFISDDDSLPRRARISERERAAAELLAMAYQTLGRDNLADLAELDLRERKIPWATPD
ncbi:hypothetical protein GCM10023205_82490 [Yinghuangia aomiensis]|uniref:Knr4/Smi1-like domain-containing protein n=1 Tax=Yinghuangia aomiensis TaxID=676205 RepID=A0ABP9IH09_9ACTN